MNRINSVRIENFQSHQDTTLDFTNGLNVIIGPSDQGKSAVLRAIKWVLYNEPRGIDYIRHGTTTARVSVEMSNGYTITRERSKSKNRYIVAHPDKETAVFESFGNEVPAEVIKAHGILKVMLDSDISASLNIGGQLEGPFLLSETGAVRAKAIGRLIGVHTIDRANRDCMVDLRRETQTSERVKSDLEEIEARLREYENLDGLKDRLEQSEQLLKRLEEALNRQSKLEGITGRLKGLKSETEALEKTLASLKDLNECEMLLKDCAIAQVKLNSINSLNSNIKAVSEQMAKTREYLHNSNGLDVCEKALQGAESRKFKYEKLNRSERILTTVAAEIIKLEAVLNKTADIESIGDAIKEAQEKFVIVGKLDDINNKLKLFNKDMEKVKLHMDNTIKVDRVEDILSSIRVGLDSLGRMENLKQQYETIMNYVAEGIKFQDNNNRQLQKYLNEYSGCLKKAGKCPVCGCEISKEKIEDILKHYEEDNNECRL